MTVDIFSDDVPLSMTVTVLNGMQRIREAFPANDGYRVGHQFAIS